jgi:hypothetical protein
MTAALAAGAWLGGIDGAAIAWLLMFPLCYGVAFRLVLAAAGLAYRSVLLAIGGPAAAAALMVAVVLLWDAAARAVALPTVQALAGEILVGAAIYPLALRAIDGNAYRLARQRLLRLLGRRQPA